MDIREFITNGINDLTRQIEETQDKLSQLFGGRFALEQMLQAHSDGVFNVTEAHANPGIDLGELLQRSAAGEDIDQEKVVDITEYKKGKKHGGKEASNADEGDAT